MSLSIDLLEISHYLDSDGDELEPVYKEIYSTNITHNLNKMAKEVDIYDVLWNAEENGFKYAHQIVSKLTKGLELLKSDQSHYESFNSPNGWGLYKNFVPFVENYLNACMMYPNSIIEIDK